MVVIANLYNKATVVWDKENISKMRLLTHLLIVFQLDLCNQVMPKVLFSEQM